MRLASRRSLLPPRLVLGLALLVSGVAFTLDNLGWVDTGDLFDLWPLLVVLFGVSRWFGGRRRAGLVWIVLGLVFLVTRWIPDVDVWDLVWDHWPLVLVGLGLALAADAVTPRRDPRGLREETPRAEVFAFLGTSVRANASHHFSGGDLVALAGKVELDLTQARIAGDEAVIDVVAFWGGIDVRVPSEWRVALEVQSFMGGAVDATRPSSPSDGRLVVRGWTVMGAVQVS